MGPHHLNGEAYTQPPDMPYFGNPYFKRGKRTDIIWIHHCAGIFPHKRPTTYVCAQHKWYSHLVVPKREPLRFPRWVTTNPLHHATYHHPANHHPANQAEYSLAIKTAPIGKHCIYVHIQWLCLNCAGSFRRLWQLLYFPSVGNAYWSFRKEHLLCRTIRPTRKNFPRDIVPGDIGTLPFAITNKLTAVWWQDRRDVYAISNMHNTSCDETPQEL